MVSFGSTPRLASREVRPSLVLHQGLRELFMARNRKEKRSFPPKTNGRLEKRLEILSKRKGKTFSQRPWEFFKEWVAVGVGILWKGVPYLIKDLVKKLMGY